MKQFLILAAVLTLCACSETVDVSSPVQQQATAALTATDSIEVIDYSGATIRLDKPARRIVALAPHVVENIYTAGAGSSLIGVVTYSNYPEQAKSLPLVGGYTKTNHERILELNPDLVIAWQSGNSQASVARLQELGFTVYLDQPKNLRDIAKSIRDIGTLTGYPEIANKAADEYLGEIKKLELHYRTAKPVTAFYQVWNKPLQTINGDSIISAAINVCAGKNIYADEPVIAPIINLESILERDPTVIIASGMANERPEWLDEWKKWDSLTAVKNNNLFFVNPNHIQRHTVRLLDGIETICEQLELARKRKTQ